MDGWIQFPFLIILQFFGHVFIWDGILKSVKYKSRKDVSLIIYGILLFVLGRICVGRIVYIIAYVVSLVLSIIYVIEFTDEWMEI